MANGFSSLDLLLTATAIGIAAWTYVVDSPREKVESFDGKYLQLVTALMLFLSLAVLLVVFSALMTGLLGASNSGEIGAGGTALFLVLLAVVLASIPTGIGVYLQMLKQAQEFEEKRDNIIAGLLVAILGGSVIIGVLFMTI